MEANHSRVGPEDTPHGLEDPTLKRNGPHAERLDKEKACTTQAFSAMVAVQGFEPRTLRI